MSKSLDKHIESAKDGMPLNKEPEKEIKVMRRGVEINITTFPRLVNKTKYKVGRLLTRPKRQPKNERFN